MAPLPEAVTGRRAVLAVNAGSSTLKVGLYAAPDAPADWTGSFEGLERGGFHAALQDLVATLAAAQVPLAAVAHRIVHGGERFVAPCVLDDAALAALRELSSLAPLHQPHNLDGVAAFAAAFPGVPQVGCFDTAFHATLPEMERLLPLPSALREQGLRRYGFHGLSYQFVLQQLQARTPRAQGRVLMAHLGNGASLCAAEAGRSVATTMGFSALDGLMMGTRSGSLDPGVLLHLWRAGWTLPQVESLLYRECGLKGVSGLSADLRTLRANGGADAQRAIDLFAHRARREAGALAALLGGVDVLAFTGGIGEHDAPLRAAIAQALALAGVQVDAAKNDAARGEAAVRIDAAASRAEVWVVPTDEGRVAATAAFHLVTR